MCRYQTLFYDDVKGYIIHCHECNTIQLAFGNVLLTLYREDFYGLQHCINRLAEDCRGYENCPNKCIVVPTPCEGIKFLVSSRELLQLREMMDTAETELRSLELMKLFDDAR